MSSPLTRRPLVRSYTKADSETPLTKHFKAGEFNTGNEPVWFICELLLHRLESIRVRVGRPLRITSGYRSPAYNREVGGSVDSRHTYGLAADIAVKSRAEADEIIGIAWSLGFRRIGRAKTFVHLDTDHPVTGTSDTWSYAGAPPLSESDCINLAKI